MGKVVYHLKDRKQWAKKRWLDVDNPEEDSGNPQNMGWLHEVSQDGNINEEYEWIQLKD